MFTEESVSTMKCIGVEFKWESIQHCGTFVLPISILNADSSDEYSYFCSAQTLIHLFPLWFDVVSGSFCLMAATFLRLPEQCCRYTLTKCPALLSLSDVVLRIITWSHITRITDHTLQNYAVYAQFHQTWIILDDHFIFQHCLAWRKLNISNRYETKKTVYFCLCCVICVLRVNDCP